MGVTADTYAYLEWGETTLYVNTTPVQVRATTGVYSATIAGYNPQITHHYRTVLRIGAGTVYAYGSDQTFKVGTPTTYILVWLVPAVFILFGIVTLLVLRNGPIALIVTALTIAVGAAVLSNLVESLW